MTPALRIFKLLKMIRVYEDGDGYGFIWWWINPLTWFFAPLVFIVSCGLIGIPNAWRSRAYNGFGLTSYFIHNPDKLKWIK